MVVCDYNPFLDSQDRGRRIHFKTRPGYMRRHGDKMKSQEVPKYTEAY